MPKDEPTYLLRASDPIAPFLLSIAAKVRNADPEAAIAVFNKMWAEVGAPYMLEPDTNAATAAMVLALDMFKWREANGIQKAHSEGGSDASSS